MFQISFAGTRSAAAGLSRSAVVGAIVVVALGWPLAGSAVATGELRIHSVQFELDSTPSTIDGGAAGGGAATIPAGYVGVQVGHDGVVERLRPVRGVTATVVDQSARVGGDVDLMTTASVQHRALIAAGDGSVTIDLGLPRPLSADDAILIQEGGGDGRITVSAVGSDGLEVGEPVVAGPPYAWNTGHTSSDGSRQWASVVEPPGVGAGTVTGLRVRSELAEVKVVVLEPVAVAVAGAEAVAGQPASTASSRGVIDEPAPSPPEGSAEAGIAVERDVAAGDAATAQPLTPAPGPGVAAAGSTDTTGTADTTGTGAAAVPALPTEADIEPAPAVDHTPAVDPDPIAEVSDGGPGAEPGSSPAQNGPTVTALAMTGVPTEPWTLVALATGLMFFGYTAIAAYRRPSHLPDPGESSGHDQLDALGFD